MKVIRLILAALPIFSACSSGSILLEAEFFQDKGGWTADSQFMDQMGSPYLLAHGLGTPVADASTSFDVEEAGTYHVWVRTYNWNAPWDETKCPGLFRVAFDGTSLECNLGTCPSWDWQKAGSVRLEKGAHTLALQDLTGFEGRCDAIFLSRSANPSFPSSPRYDVSQAENAGEYDVVVVGGGVGGVVTAISAARLGMKTVLIQNRPVPGGNNSTEVRVSVLGGLFAEPLPKMGNILSEIGNIYRDPERVKAVLAAEENLDVVYNRNVVKAGKKGSSISSVIAYDVTDGALSRYSGRIFVDCTGDGNLGFLAGAEYMMGRETRDVFGEDLAPEIPMENYLGSSMYWTSADMGCPVTFPSQDWMIEFTPETAQKVTRSVWYWETGFAEDQIVFAEKHRDYVLKVAYSNWAYLKNAPQTRDEYANLAIDWAGYILGKRESRRILGDYIVTQHDVEGKAEQVPDGAAVCTYTMDLHYPRPENTIHFPGQEFMSIQKHNHNPQGKVKVMTVGENVNYPFLIPLRSLYSKNIDNMFIASRCISCSHVAHAATRVMATIALEGEAVAAAASICCSNNCRPRDVYESHLDEFKAMLDKGLPSRGEPVFTPRAHL